MKLRELNLVSYGKLLDKKIELKDNFNLICGPNESGKSTIRSFVFNMLFGGTVPGSKRTIYTKDYERNIPWISSRYEGSMIIEYEELSYYFYRNFMKTKESLTIHNLISGEDAKSIFHVDPSKKVESLDETFFGVSESTLRDLFIISDELIMEENLSYDLKDRIINHFSTQSETMSVESLISKIENYTFGKDDKKELRNINSELNSVEESLKHQFDSNEYDLILKKIEKINDIILEKENALAELEFNFQKVIGNNDIITNNKSSQDLHEIGKVENKIEELEDKILQLSKFSNPYGKVLILISIFSLILGVIFNKKLLMGLGLVFLLGFLYSIFQENSLKSKKNDLRLLYNELDLLLEKKDSSSNVISNIDIQSNYERIGEIRREISESKILKEKLLERIRHLDGEKERLNFKNSKKKELSKRLEELNFNKDMGEISISILKKISKSNFLEASTVLIEDSSEFIKEITNGKYSKLYIGDKGEITLFDEEISQMVNVDDLSQGTIGQVYLAYRLGLIVNSGIDFPIFIDDGLTLYDEERKKASLNLLKKISKDYQIIFFTNHKDILFDNQLNEGINLINL
ncbi:MAG: AAA family ATPase [Tissierellia bacterium]|nr:AAA family ATPase [Tissierellia bacterium]